MKYIIITINIILCAIFLIAAPNAFARDYSASKYDDNRWKTIKADYLNSETDRLIFVKYKSGSSATVEMWKKAEVIGTPQYMEGEPDSTEEKEQPDYTWEKILSTKAYVGSKGINKKKQGDMKTPTGNFNITYLQIVEGCKSLLEKIKEKS